MVRGRSVGLDQRAGRHDVGRERHAVGHGASTGSDAIHPACIATRQISRDKGPESASGRGRTEPVRASNDLLRRSQGLSYRFGSESRRAGVSRPAKLQIRQSMSELHEASSLELREVGAVLGQRKQTSPGSEVVSEHAGGASAFSTTGNSGTRLPMRALVVGRVVSLEQRLGHAHCVYRALCS
jgi:hypothetical protein